MQMCGLQGLRDALDAVEPPAAKRARSGDSGMQPTLNRATVPLVCACAKAPAQSAERSLSCIPPGLTWPSRGRCCARLFAFEALRDVVLTSVFSTPTDFDRILGYIFILT